MEYTMPIEEMGGLDLSVLSSLQKQEGSRYFRPEAIGWIMILHQLPNDEYHARREYLSASTLKQATTPRMYGRYLAEGFRIGNPTALSIGTLLHSLVLEPHKRHEFILYDEQKMLDTVQEMMPGTQRENLKRTKAWKGMLTGLIDEQGRMLPGVIETKRFSAIWETAKSIRDHRQLINLFYDSRAELSVLVRFEKLWVKVRPDLLKIADQDDAEYLGIRPGDLIILSVKTTIDASPAGFERECRKFRYELAEAFYQDIVRAARVHLGAAPEAQVHTFYLAVEKDSSDMLTGQFLLRRCTKAHIDRGRTLYERHLQVYLHCQEDETYAAGYDFFNDGSILMDID